MTNKMNITTTTKPLESGYDLPITGLDNGQFLAIHIPALICIFCGLISAITVIVVSFTNQKANTFFKWTKSERFAVYIAICDGFFNICHSMDHLHIAITRNHVYPKMLCRFYGFMLAEFITAQNLMVNVVSINAFVLIFYRKNIDFGVYDWRLLLWMFGTPFVAAIVALSAGTLGPNGAFCFFDGVKGTMANMFFVTVPLATILITNLTLCFICWLGMTSSANINSQGTTKKLHKESKTMSLYLIAYITQWTVYIFYGIRIHLSHHIPFFLRLCAYILMNIGGLLHLLVFLFIRRDKTDEELPKRKEIELATTAASSFNKIVLDILDSPSVPSKRLSTIFEEVDKSDSLKSLRGSIDIKEQCVEEGNSAEDGNSVSSFSSLEIHKEKGFEETLRHDEVEIKELQVESIL